MQATRWFMVVCIAVGVVALGIGILIGYFCHSHEGRPAEERSLELVKDLDPSITADLIQEMKAENIRETLKLLSAKPHLAGTPADLKTAEFIRDRWTEYGLEVEIFPYDVLLSYPSEDHNNTVSIMESDGRVIFTTSGGDTGTKLADDQEDGVPPFNAFSPTGTPVGQLTYVNYGRPEDYDDLHRLGVNCSGNIVIARYGKTFRGNKVQLAYEAGAIGVILFSDPADHLESRDSQVFPDSWWLPGTGVQRGGLAINKGDQYTPGYPSKWYSYRLTDKEVEDRLPKIPVHPIGYNDALPLLRSMEGAESPAHFKGWLPVEYRLGPTMNNSRTVKMNVKNYRATRTIYNVIGKIRGTIEEDRYVLLGNHRDAWVQGALDPTTGTATLLEVTRAFGELTKKGWRPRRTMLFCSWGAEEFGLIGSTEWVEEHLRILDKRAVAYLNMDIAVRGNWTFYGRAVPILRKAVIDATKKVPDPHNPKETVYDSWKRNLPDPTSTYQIFMAIPASGSDFHPFLLIAGIPTVDARYRWPVKEYSISNYPLYHTAYDVFSQVKYIDPEFVCHQAVARVVAVLLHDLVDSHILPLDVVEYATSMQSYTDHLVETTSSSFLEAGVSSDGIVSAAKNFSKSAADFHKQLKDININDPIQVRMVNDKLMLLERVFIDPSGLPGRPEIRHIILAPSRSDIYSGAVFPGLSDLMNKIGVNDTERWESVKKHLSVITYAIESAAILLRM